MPPYVHIQGRLRSWGFGPWHIFNTPAYVKTVKGFVHEMGYTTAVTESKYLRNISEKLVHTVVDNPF